MKSTKIVATLGPASLAPGVLEDLLAAGVDVVRINCSHGDLDDHVSEVALVRSAAKELGRNVAVLADLQGPKIRVGSLPSEGFELVTGTSVRLLSGVEEAPADVVPVVYPHLAKDVEAGDRVLLHDGLLELIVLDSDPGSGLVEAQVTRGGTLFSRKGINLPGVAVTATSPTEKDLEDLGRMHAAGVDYVALSFVRDARDVRTLRRAVAELEGMEDPERALDPDALVRTRVGIVSKLERPEAMEHLDEVLCASDAVMVARGDLGVETGPEFVPVLQKRIIRAANSRGVPVITATEMLESMVSGSRPTRAEASDVANAVFDGTDAVMLSGETAVGADPVGVVQMMRRICDQAESAPELLPPRKKVIGGSGPARAVARSVAQAVEDLEAKGVVVFTQTGASSRFVSAFRPGVPILTLSPDEGTLRRCALHHGVRVDLVQSTTDPVVLTEQAHARAISSGLAGPGDTVIVVAGVPGQTGGTNRMLVLPLEPPPA